MGTVVTAVAKTAKLVKYATKAAKIAKTCRDIGRIGNAVAGMKALYDTYQTAERECETTGEKIAYIAGTVITGYLVGKAANKGAEALKKFASKAIPKLKTALRENAGKLVSKVSGAFSSFGSKGGSNLSEKRLYRVMSAGELNVVKETGKLRGGKEGRTYFTDSYYKNANSVKSRLALPEKPTYIMEFEIKNSPNISGGTRVQPAYNEVGGGREFFTDDIIEVKIINYQKIIGGER